MVTPTITSTYTITGINVGCNYTTTITEIVTTCLGIGEFSTTGNGLLAFPNPFTDRITVLSNIESSSQALLKIYNTLGSTIYVSKFENQKAEIDLNDLQSGIYFLEVNEGGNVSGVKLIKN